MADGMEHKQILADDKTRSKLISVAYNIVKDYSLAEDIYQEACIKIIQNADKFRGDSKFSTWAYRIVANTALNTLKKMKRTALDQQSCVDVEDVIGTATETPEKILELMETSDCLQKCIDNLPSSIREAVLLREYEGMSYECISESLEIPIGTVRSRIFRGREYISRSINETNI